MSKTWAQGVYRYPALFDFFFFSVRFFWSSDILCGSSLEFVGWRPGFLDVRDLVSFAVFHHDERCVIGRDI